MILKVLPSVLKEDRVWAPPSKSIMQRVVALATLAEGTTMIHRPSESDDCTHALMMAAQLGADIELGEDAIAIHGRFPLAPRSNVITPGESGLGLRMFGMIAALHPEALTFERTGSLLRRDASGMADALQAFGVEVHGISKGEHPVIHGGLVGGDVCLDAGGSSQMLTGLLCALPHAPQNSTVKLNGLVSKPYLQMTMEILEDMGIQIQKLEESDDGRTMTLFVPGGQRAKAMEMTVDGDWSAAAFLLGIGALCAPRSLMIEGLHGTYTQADEAVKGALLFGGCRLGGLDSGVEVMAGKPREFQMDLTDCPDLFPPLAALAAFGQKPSTFKGIHRLLNKESNRARVIKSEWQKLGIEVILDTPKDTMTVIPGSVKSARMDAHGDHRMAMAAALFGAAGAPVEISGAEAVAKSYPAFFDDLEALGVQVQVIAN